MRSKCNSRSKIFGKHWILILLFSVGLYRVECFRGFRGSKFSKMRGRSTAGERESKSDEIIDETMALWENEPPTEITLSLVPVGPKKANDPDQYGTKSWHLVGCGDCRPTFSCSVFDLEVTKKQFLEISDGIAGYQRFFGKQTPNNIIASPGNRDLFIKLLLDYDVGPSYLKCEISCAKSSKTKYEPLPEAKLSKHNPKCVCGAKLHSKRIIGGEKTLPNEFPWIAAIVFKGSRQPFCIGTVINDRTILSAAHCFRGKYKNPKRFQVLIGTYTVDPTANPFVMNRREKIRILRYDHSTLRAIDRGNHTSRHSVFKLHRHPLYANERKLKDGTVRTKDYDAAILILDRKISPEFFSPACVPDHTSNLELFEGEKCEIAGWGLPSPTAKFTNTKIMKIDVTVKSEEYCKKSIGDRYLHDHVFCAEYPGNSKDSCAGDSGGPITMEVRPEVFFQVGIISWGDSCAVVGNPGVYYRTTDVAQWIRYISDSYEAQWCMIP